MRQRSLDSLIRTANTAGAIVIYEYDWHSLTCFLNMNDPQSELRWELQRLIFEAKTHVWGGYKPPS